MTPRRKSQTFAAVMIVLAITLSGLNLWRQVHPRTVTISPGFDKLQQQFLHDLDDEGLKEELRHRAFELVSTEELIKEAQRRKLLPPMETVKGN
ncbi:MAG: hypothetical protein ABI977_16555 [Acidobacteriota bacterium]